MAGKKTSEDEHTVTPLNDFLSGWSRPEDIPVDAHSPVLVLCKDCSMSVEWQYVCWPPDGDTGWLMCLPDEYDHDFDLSKSSQLSVIGWKRLGR